MCDMEDDAPVSFAAHIATVVSSAETKEDPPCVSEPVAGTSVPLAGKDASCRSVVTGESQYGDQKRVERLSTSKQTWAGKVVSETTPQSPNFLIMSKSVSIFNKRNSVGTYETHPPKYKADHGSPSAGTPWIPDTNTSVATRTRSSTADRQLKETHNNRPWFEQVTLPRRDPRSSLRRYLHVASTRRFHYSDMRSIDLEDHTQVTDNMVDHSQWVQFVRGLGMQNPLAFLDSLDAAKGTQNLQEPLRAQDTGHPLWHGTCYTEDVLQLCKSPIGVGSTASVFVAQMKHRCDVHGVVIDRHRETACCCQLLRVAYLEHMLRSGTPRVAIKRLYPEVRDMAKEVPDSYFTIREAGVATTCTNPAANVVQLVGISRSRTGALDLWMPLSDASAAVLLSKRMVPLSRWPRDGSKQGTILPNSAVTADGTSPRNREVFMCHSFSFFNVVLDLCWGMKYLHEVCGMIHRDIKPSNIVLNRRHSSVLLRARYCDYGLVVPVNGDSSGMDGRTFRTHRVQTANYRALEVWLSEANQCMGYGKPADVYSLGIVLFELLAGTSLAYIPEDHDHLRQMWNRDGRKRRPRHSPQHTGKLSSNTADSFDHDLLFSSMARVHGLLVACGNPMAAEYVAAMEPLKDLCPLDDPNLPMYLYATRHVGAFQERLGVNKHRIIPASVVYTINDHDARRIGLESPDLDGESLGNLILEMMLSMIRPDPAKRLSILEICELPVVQFIASLCGCSVSGAPKATRDRTEHGRCTNKLHHDHWQSQEIDVPTPSVNGKGK
jgi:serine/threonine protein kinase